MKTDSPTLISSVTLLSTILLAMGCGQPTRPGVTRTPLSSTKLQTNNTHPTSFKRSPVPASPSLTFVVPEHVKNIFKRKCYICHGGGEVEGGFDLKKMIYQPEPESNWQPMDLAGVTRIKLAILPLDGKPARMPKRAGSIWNPLSVEEANGVAKWTDYPYER